MTDIQTTCTINRYGFSCRQVLGLFLASSGLDAVFLVFSAGLCLWAVVDRVICSGSPELASLSEIAERKINDEEDDDAVAGGGFV